MTEILPTAVAPKRKGRAPRKKQSKAFPRGSPEEPRSLVGGTPIRNIGRRRAIKQRMKHPKTDEFGLKFKERKFCDAYLLNPDLAAAFVAAGYKSTAKLKGAQLVYERPQVQNYIEQRRAKVLVKHENKAELVIQELLRIAMFDPAGMFNEHGALLDIPQMPLETRRAISGVDVITMYAGKGEERKEVGHTTKLRFVDKKGALDSLSKIFGMNHQDKIDVNGIAELMSIVAGSQQGSTIGRIDATRNGERCLPTGRTVPRSALETEQSVLYSEQGGGESPFQAKLGARGTVGKLLVLEPDIEGTATRNDDIS
jgi:phage terminase small subunit